MKPATLFLFLAALAIAAAPDTPLADFSSRVGEYVTLRQSVQASMPAQRSTKNRKEVMERRHSLAAGIRARRAGAKQGDIFTPANTEAFRRIIATVFRGTNAPNVRRTIRQRENITDWVPSVNAGYPDLEPRTTVPPTLLARLPGLPPGLVYRLVGRDFTLCDLDASIVIDLIPGALP